MGRTLNSKRRVEATEATRPFHDPYPYPEKQNTYDRTFSVVEEIEDCEEEPSQVPTGPGTGAPPRVGKTRPALKRNSRWGSLLGCEWNNRSTMFRFCEIPGVWIPVRRLMGTAGRPSQPNQNQPSNTGRRSAALTPRRVYDANYTYN